VAVTAAEGRFRVLCVTPELAPWAKSGGLGDVSSALPLALREIGFDARILVPAYSALRAACRAAQPVCHETRFPGQFEPARLLTADLPGAAPLILVDCPPYYERAGGPYQDTEGRDWPDNHLRFGLLSRVAALLGSAEAPLEWMPDVVHCHDWPAGLAPAYLHFASAARSATLMTIHNAAFQGIFPAATLAALGLPARAYSVEGVEYYGNLSFLKAGIHYADWISTVSPTYAREIQTPELGCGMDGLLRHRRARLSGILNGIDTARWNPATDPALPERYDAGRLARKRANKLALQKRFGIETGANLPLLGVVSRLVHQKGLDLLAEIVPRLVEHPAQLVVLGTGEPEIERTWRALAQSHPRQLALVIGYDEALAHFIEAAADIFIMPSRFEPCGLNQLYSMRYGTPPVVRATGGLADTVVDCNPTSLADGTATGFIFHKPAPADLWAAIERALTALKDAAAWRAIQLNGMRRDFSWQASAQRYAELYRAMVASPRR
jgi:starch synthase